MNIPNFIDTKVVDDNGYLTDTWKSIFMQLFTELQNNVSNEGYKVPQQEATNITALNTTKSIGALLYDSDNDKLKVNIAGTFKEVVTA